MNNNNDDEILKATVVSGTYKPNNNVPTAEPIYSTKLYGNIDDDGGDDGGDREVASDFETRENLLRVTNDMNMLFSLRYSLKCFMICQVISACLYSSFNPFFFLFLFFNYYVYKAICQYDKKGVWVYMCYLIGLNILRLVFFIWTLIAINNFDTEKSYNGNDGGGNQTANTIYIFHYGPTGYTVLFFFLNTFIDMWFIKLLRKYYNLIESTSIFEINHLLQHGGGKKYILLW